MNASQIKGIYMNRFMERSKDRRTIKKAGMPALSILFIIFVLSSTSMSVFAAEDIEWVEKQSGAKLYWGDSVTVDGYEIKAEDFSEDMVFLSISKNGEILKTSPLSSGMDLTYDDKIKVYAQNVNPNYETINRNGEEFRTQNKNPYSELNIFLRGEPHLDIKVETRKDSYNPKNSGENKIDVSVNIKNDGEAKAENLVLTIDPAGMELLSGKSQYKFDRLLKGETLEPVNFVLKSPAPWEDTDYQVTAKIKCTDIRNKEYEYSGSKTIKIEKKWGLAVSKNFPKECHMGKPVHVSVDIRNQGLCDINEILLKDSLSPDMNLQEETEMEKKISLKAGEKAERVLKYTLIPDAPGEFTLPEATATFILPDGQAQEADSGDSKTIKIYGPNIVITKTVDKQKLNPGDELNITVTAQNLGNVNANITLNDLIPPEAELIGGTTNFRQVLANGGGSRTITYTLKMKEKGEILLPPCKARFIDLERYSGETASNSPIVYVGVPLPQENSTQPEGQSVYIPEENETLIATQKDNTEENFEKTPGFGIIYSLTIILGISNLLKKKIAAGN